MTKRRYLPALRGRLGDWAFYSVLMTLKQVAEKVNYAKEVHNSVKLSELIQRELDDKARAGEIGNYLLTNKDRFFNSLVVAVYDGDPEWHEFHNLKPISSDIDVDDIDYSSRYSVGYLSLSGSEKLFALDGQHRLAGIRSALAQDESIGEDELSVIVVAHHTSAAGQKRTRKLFTTLNKTAKPVSKSEIIALDEADAMAITARRLVEEDPRFSDKLLHIKSKQTNLPQTDREHLMTLINLYDTLEILFCKSKKGTNAVELKRFRPNDEELDAYASSASSFFTLLGKIAPELRRCLDSATPGVEIKKHRHAEGGHVLFRPVGILIYAEIVAALMRGASMNLADAVAELKSLPTELSKPPYAGVLWDEATGTMMVKNRALTRELLLYYLGFLKDPARIRKMEARYALLRGEDSVKPPVRTGMKTSRLVRRTRSK